MKRLIKAFVLFLAFSLVMLATVSAATLGEMYENGVVSDDGIRLGDARDGAVSDVSDVLMGEGTGMLDDMINGTDGSSAQNTTKVPDSTSSSGNSATNGATNDDAGMGIGVVIAVLVVIAVIVIIFLLLPKRK